MIMISKIYRGFGQTGQKITSLRKSVKSEKAESKSFAPKTESKIDKAESKFEAKPEAKVEVKPEAKSEAVKLPAKQPESAKYDDATNY
jgi:hypothetical protein